MREAATHIRELRRDLSKLDTTVRATSGEELGIGEDDKAEIEMALGAAPQSLTNLMEMLTTE